MQSGRQREGQAIAHVNKKSHIGDDSLSAASYANIRSSSTFPESKGVADSRPKRVRDDSDTSFPAGKRKKNTGRDLSVQVAIPVELDPPKSLEQEKPLSLLRYICTTLTSNQVNKNPFLFKSPASAKELLYYPVAQIQKIFTQALKHLSQEPQTELALDEAFNIMKDIEIYDQELLKKMDVKTEVVIIQMQKDNTEVLELADRAVCNLLPPYKMISPKATDGPEQLVESVIVELKNILSNKLELPDADEVDEKALNYFQARNQGLLKCSVRILDFLMIEKWGCARGERPDVITFDTIISLLAHEDQMVVELASSCLANLVLDMFRKPDAPHDAVEIYPLTFVLIIAVLQFLERYSDNDAIIQHACFFFSSCSWNVIFLNIICRKGGFRLLSSLVIERGLKGSTLLWAARCLGSFIFNALPFFHSPIFPDGTQSILSGKAIIMKKFFEMLESTDEDVVIWTCTFLGKLALETKRYRAPNFLTTDGPPLYSDPLLNLLKLLSKNQTEKVLETALWCLLQMVAHRSCRMLFTKAEIFSYLVDLIRHPNQGIVELVTRNLSAYSVYNGKVDEFDLSPVLDAVVPLLTQSTNDEVIVWACIYLGHLSTNSLDYNKKARVALGKEKGGIAALIELLNDTMNEKVKEAALWCLHKLAWNRDNQTLISTSGGFNLVVSLLDKETHDSRIVEVACLCFGNLSVIPQNQEVIQNSGIRKMTELLSHSNNNVVVLACRCLSALSALTTPKSKDNQLAINELGGVTRVLKLLEQQSDDEVILESACFCLCNLLNEDNDEAYPSAALISVINLLDHKNEKIIEGTCWCLHKLANQKEHQVIIGKYGGFERIISLLSHPNDKIVAGACWCFSKLSVIAENHRILEDSEGIKAVIKLLHHRNEKIVVLACRCLGTLSVNTAAYCKENQAFIGKYKGLEALVKLLTNMNDAIQETACWCLASLSVNKENQIAITEKQGIDPIIMLLSHRNDKVAEGACFCLCNLISKDNSQDIGVKGGIEALLILLTTNKSEKIVERACLGLSKLAFNPENKRIITQKKGLPTLISLLSNPNESILASAAWCLGTIASVYAQELIHANASLVSKSKPSLISSLVNLVKNLRRNTKIVEGCLFCLTNLALIRDPEIQTELTKGISSFLELLEHQNEAIVCRAYSLLLNMALHLQNEAAFTKPESVSALLSVFMTSRNGSPDTEMKEELDDDQRPRAAIDDDDDVSMFSEQTCTSYPGMSPGESSGFEKLAGNEGTLPMFQPPHPGFSRITILMSHLVKNYSDLWYLLLNDENFLDVIAKQKDVDPACTFLWKKAQQDGKFLKNLEERAKASDSPSVWSTLAHLNPSREVKEKIFQALQNVDGNDKETISAYFEAISATNVKDSEKMDMSFPVTIEAHLGSDRFRTIYDQKLFYDLVFKIASTGQEIECHRIIAACGSKYFEKQLTSSSSKASAGAGAAGQVVEITGIRFELFSKLVSFLYLKKVSVESISETIEILYASNRFKIPELETVCVTFLSGNIMKESFLEIFECADKLQLMELKTKLIDWFSLNFNRLRQETKLVVLNQWDKLKKEIYKR